jgi:peptide/nickel transport system permease protein
VHQASPGSGVTDPWVQQRVQHVGYLLGGAVIIEQIFALPGLGTLVLNGITQRDYPVVQAGVLFIAASFVLVNLAVDVLYAYLDPKIHYG